MSEKYVFIKYEKLGMLPVIRDREVIELLKEIAREYLKMKGIDADSIRVFDIEIRAQPFVGDKPRPFHTINIAVAKQDELVV